MLNVFDVCKSGKEVEWRYHSLAWHGLAGVSVYSVESLKGVTAERKCVVLCINRINMNKLKGDWTKYLFKITKRTLYELNLIIKAKKRQKKC